MARQERAVRTRKGILDAAASVFDERGYEGTSISEVLERAEVTRGAMYFHFRSKEQLARGVLDEAVTMAGVEPEGLRLQQVVDGALVLAYRLPREPQLSASVSLSVDPKARGLFGTRWPDWIELTNSLLEAAGDEGELLPHVEPAEVARLIVSMWTGIQVVSTSLSCAPPLVDEIASMFALVLPNIARPLVLKRLDVTVERAARLAGGIVEPEV